MTITVDGKEYDIVSIHGGPGGTLNNDIIIHAEPHVDVLYKALREMNIPAKCIKPLDNRSGYRITKSGGSFQYAIWTKDLPTDKSYSITIDNGNLVIY